MYFLSSIRRHTRLQGDWSSDVCSSDLTKPSGEQPRGLHGCIETAIDQRHAGNRFVFRREFLGRGPRSAFFNQLSERVSSHRLDRKSVVKGKRIVNRSAEEHRTIRRRWE